MKLEEIMAKTNAFTMTYSDWVGLDPDDVKKATEHYVILWAHDYDGYMILVEREAFDKNNKHIGTLETLASFPTGWTGETDAVVRWCAKCGAVVIDKEVDGRLAYWYVKMKFPEITKEALKK